jgi:hypothetical protein
VQKFSLPAALKKKRKKERKKNKPLRRRRLASAAEQKCVALMRRCASEASSEAQGTAEKKSVQILGPCEEKIIRAEIVEQSLEIEARIFKIGFFENSCRTWSENI